MSNVVSNVVCRLRLVARNFSLLYRRISFGGASLRLKSRGEGGTPQVENLRYGRLKVCATGVAVAVGLFGANLLAQKPASGVASVRFHTMDIFVDVKDKPLAAYQLEFSVTNTDAGAKIVGIEGGEHPAFAEPPFYDPKAMQRERVILAAFSTNAVSNLPSGKTRVATIHFQTRGAAEPEFELKLWVAADAGGNRIEAAATFEERKAK